MLYILILFAGSLTVNYDMSKTLDSGAIYFFIDDTTYTFTYGDFLAMSDKERINICFLWLILHAHSEELVSKEQEIWREFILELLPKKRYRIK